MKIQIACPAPPGSLKGNRVTANRIARIFRGLGHTVIVSDSNQFAPKPTDLLVALHAVSSAVAINEWKLKNPHQPVWTVLTGTDIYRKRPADSYPTFQISEKLILLNAKSHLDIPTRFREKTIPILQSARSTPSTPKHQQNELRVIVVGHIRDEKDPLRAAYAVRKLPQNSKIQIRLFGEALTTQWRKKTEKEDLTNDRFRWLGPKPRWYVRRQIARSDVLVLTSRSEGGAAVLGEAVVDGVPVLATRINSTIGMLGADYPGYFDVGETRELRTLMLRFENDVEFRNQLQHSIRKLKKDFSVETETESWKKLLVTISL